MLYFFLHISLYAGIITTGDIDPSDPSTWTSSTEAYVGKTSDGSVTVEKGSSIKSLRVYLVFNRGSAGEVTITGEGSTWNNDHYFLVGYSGTGELNITNGGTFSSSVNCIGFWPGSQGTVIVDGEGSTWTNSGNLYVGRSGTGELVISDRGLVSVAEVLTIDYDENYVSFVNISGGGMLALFGEADDSIGDFLGLVDGTDAIRYWDDYTLDWSDITSATYGEGYTLNYMTEGELAGYTVLTVYPIPEPATILLLGLSAFVLRCRKR